MGIYGFDGEGTQGSPYIIASAGDWNGLVTNVAKDETYSGKYFQLAANITVSRMVGGEYIPFRGTFDGAGNKLTFNFTDPSKSNSLKITSDFNEILGLDAQKGLDTKVDTSKTTLENVQVFLKEGMSPNEICYKCEKLVTCDQKHDHKCF